jgi:hypothetical protein
LKVIAVRNRERFRKPAAAFASCPGRKSITIEKRTPAFFTSPIDRPHQIQVGSSGSKFSKMVVKLFEFLENSFEFWMISTVSS